MSYLLDSTGLIDWLKGRRGVAPILEQLASTERLAVNAISMAEVYSGVADKDLAVTDRLFGGFDYWPIDPPTARLAGTYRYRYARMGRPLSVTDMLMAASAVRNDATLVTGNVKDFPMPELKLMRLPAG